MGILLRSTWLFTFGVYLTALQAQNLDCDFETDLCSWTTPSTSDRNWTRSNTKSKSPNTGPSTGHTTSGMDYFIYLFANDFRGSNAFIQPGKCVLLSPVFNTSASGGCFRFWYHMQGRGVGNLTLKLLDDGDGQVKWFKNGQSGTGWTCAFFSIDENKANLKIEITAHTGPNVQGDTALDDLKYFSQRCHTLTDLCVDMLTSSTTTATSASSRSSESPVAVSVRSTSTSTSSLTSQALPVTTEPPGNPDMLILYIAVVPIVILLIGGVVAFICYKKRKKKDKEFFVPRENNPTPPDNYREGQTEGPTEEVYDELNEVNMNDDYSVPVITSPYSEFHTGVGNGYVGPYLKMNSNPKDAESDAEDYIDSIPGPREGCNRTQGVGLGNSTDTLEQDLGSGGYSAGRLVERPQGYWYAPGVKERDFVDGRKSPMADYDRDDVNAPPPRCGNTSGYIRAVHD